jgi:membrane-associated phospholipid phosphatase
MRLTGPGLAHIRWRTLSRRKMGRAFAAFLLLVIPAAAQSQSVVQNAWYDLKHAASDVVHVYTGPFHAGKSDWAMFGVIMGGSTALSLLDDDVDSWIVDHRAGTLGDVTQPFRDSPLVHLGSGHRMMKGLAVVWVAGLALESQSLRDAGMGCMASIQANALVRSVLYKTISRTRPDSANGDQYLISVPGGEWRDHAFPGGHGANAHACATYLADRFDLDWPAYILHGAAGGVALGRMIDRRHWLSDAIIGGAMGVAMGRTIAARSRNRVEERETAANETNGLSLRFVPNGREVFLGVNYRF